MLGYQGVAPRKGWEVWPCWRKSHWGWTLRFQGPTLAKCLFLLLVYPEAELSAAFPAPCLPVCGHALHHDNGLSLETVSKPQINVFFYRVAMVMVSLNNNGILTKIPYKAGLDDSSVVLTKAVTKDPPIHPWTTMAQTTNMCISNCI